MCCASALPRIRRDWSEKCSPDRRHRSSESPWSHRAAVLPEHLQHNPSVRSSHCDARVLRHMTACCMTLACPPPLPSSYTFDHERSATGSESSPLRCTSATTRRNARITPLATTLARLLHAPPGWATGSIGGSRSSESLLAPSLHTARLALLSSPVYFRSVVRTSESLHPLQLLGQWLALPGREESAGWLGQMATAERLPWCLTPTASTPSNCGGPRSWRAALPPLRARVLSSETQLCLCAWPGCVLVSLSWG